ncbi:Glycosyl transferase family 17 [Arabidopsis thaliana x Arabidopsis arenosa]|uniref:Glycosyl transferase family 17 n=1 Tax=Arabidopsis thaliana x Arabidopsis arenosa TaxID=1240361 RepID=A0A8T1ZJ77_9BRAS|nr:Glycosyl transferase family 17 [Arabidopsis thaliana x Arabidopsis arenosa]
MWWMMEEDDGHYCSKKTVDICGGVCGQDSGKFVSISRLCFVLRGVDMKPYVFLLVIVLIFVLAGYVHGQKISYFLRPLWESPPKPFIRWRELYPYVTQFVILESNSTFTGLPKPLVFAEHMNEFGFVEPRLNYGLVGGRHTVNLLRWCDEIRQILHLRLKNYLYSFEFLLDNKSWRASVQSYQTGKMRYAHYRQSDDILADSGWHCNFCFRHISEFVFKMKAYSGHFLNPKRVQRVIWKGGDLFYMRLEEYTFKEIIRKIGPIAHSFSAVYLPLYLLDNACLS